MGRHLRKALAALGAATVLIAPQAAAPASLVAASPSMTDLGTLGGRNSIALELNNRGQVVGNSTTASGEEHAFLWEAGTMTDLGTLGGNWSWAFYLNERGQVVGESGTATEPERAFLWEDGVMTDLGTLGGDRSWPAGVNNRGQVVGFSITVTGDGHAFLWERGVMTDLGALGGGAMGWMPLVVFWLAGQPLNADSRRPPTRRARWDN